MIPHHLGLIILRLSRAYHPHLGDHRQPVHRFKRDPTSADFLTSWYIHQNYYYFHCQSYHHRDHHFLNWIPWSVLELLFHLAAVVAHLCHYDFCLNPSSRDLCSTLQTYTIGWMICRDAELIFSVRPWRLGISGDWRDSSGWSRMKLWTLKWFDSLDWKYSEVS